MSDATLKLLPTPICRLTFATDRLVAQHPPIWGHPNKEAVYRVACPPGSRHGGQIAFSRWQAPPLPDRLFVAGGCALEPRPDVFTYDEDGHPSSSVHWYLNFAHWDLFCSYGGGLFAQDEMQVAEHPALGSLREALLADDVKPFTVENGEPTPVLIQGAERRVAVATNPDPAQGRPEGLYGNRFMRASTAAVERACHRLDPPTVTNLIAMEAPTGGPGVYSREDLVFILRSALTGFAAARLLTHEEQALGGNTTTVIHTGFWGCGAYGGNRVLMALLQIIAAHASGVDRLVFHTVDAAGLTSLAQAREIHEREVAPLGPTVSGDILLLALQGLRFEWGVGDGN